MKQIFLLSLILTPPLLSAQSKNITDTSRKMLQSSGQNPLRNPEPTSIGSTCGSYIVFDTTAFKPRIVINSYPSKGTLADPKLNPSEIKRITVLKDLMAGSFTPVEQKLTESLNGHPKPATEFVFNSAPKNVINIKGKIFDEEGDPLQGVRILIKGTKITVTTNAKGEFIINGINKNAKLVFMHVAMERLKLKLKGRTKLTVKLKTIVPSCFKNTY